MKKKVSLAVLIALVIMVAAVQNAYAFHEPIIIAEADPTANIGYTPTELPNGDFEQYPDKGTTSPTGGSDWQTTETQTQTNTGVTGYFEWVDHTFNNSKYKTNYRINSSHGNFIEMNSVNPAVLYQNIDTNPTDIILWKLKHASRNNPGAPAEQNMEVWIGKDDESNQPVGTDPKITENLVQYTSDGAIGAEHYEQGILSELSALKLSKIEDWENEPNQWKEAKAVYVVPEGQTKTRFAFTSLSEGTSGNLLDEIYFETLLGNIKIDSESDENNIIITGYWAPIEENDNINIKYYLKDLDNETIEVDGTIDMSALFQSGESGFKASIPKKGLENGNYQLEIWYEHYSEALVEEIFEVDNIPENPETSDNILTYVCLLMISLFGMAFIIKFNKNKD